MIPQQQQAPRGHGFQGGMAVPPPYALRDQASSSSAVPPTSLPPTSSQMEFAETSAVTLTWNLGGLAQMYTNSVGEAKSKCIKSAIFGDADNLWEVLWYPNSGVQGGEYASLYLSCVQERDSSIGTKWSRRGLWWFRFEIRSAVPDERGKPVVFATKDASDHTFAVKTANWGWQQFARRDALFKNNLALATDSFVISCTIQAQPQPPAGYWLGVGIPPKLDVAANVAVPSPTNATGQGQQGQSQNVKVVGSGGGLSAWAGGEGASGGVAGGTAAGGGVKRVVPRDLMVGVGAMLDDELYSDVEFIIPAARSHKLAYGSSASSRARHVPNARPAARKIYANKKLLSRFDYFRAMFSGGFASSPASPLVQFETDDGNVRDKDEFDNDQYDGGMDLDDVFSDSDAEDEAAENAGLTGEAYGNEEGEYEESEVGEDDYMEGDEGTPKGAARKLGGGRKMSVGTDDAGEPSSSAGAGPEGSGTSTSGTTAGATDGHENSQEDEQAAEDGESTTGESRTSEADLTSAHAVMGGTGSSQGSKHEDIGMESDGHATDEEDPDPFDISTQQGKYAKEPQRKSATGSGKARSSGTTARQNRGSPLARKQQFGSGNKGKETRTPMGPRKTRVVIRDAAWSTWWALLYWIYTDVIYFAPLTSTFTHPPTTSSTGGVGATPNSGALGLAGAGSGAGASGTGAGAAGTSTARPGTSGTLFASRSEWIDAWLADHGAREDASALAPSGPAAGSGPGAHILPLAFTDTPHGPGPRPVSAKAIYRLADKLDMPALKLRAFQHIMSQMTAANVPAEVFSRFSSTFEDVRKVQVAYFLKHWSEIKKSETMMQIWQQIRHGKHVGFEEVWPLIVGQLDFKPS